MAVLKRPVESAASCLPENPHRPRKVKCAGNSNASEKAPKPTTAQRRKSGSSRRGSKSPAEEGTLDVPLTRFKTSEQPTRVAAEDPIRALWDLLVEDHDAGVNVFATPIYYNHSQIGKMLGMANAFRKSSYSSLPRFADSIIDFLLYVPEEERNSSKFAKALPWIYVASLLATQTILAPACFCASPCNNIACATVLQSFGVTAEMIRPLVSKVLRATYRTDDFAAIQAIRASLPKLGS